VGSGHAIQVSDHTKADASRQRESKKVSAFTYARWPRGKKRPSGSTYNWELGGGGMREGERKNGTSKKKKGQYNNPLGSEGMDEKRNLGVWKRNW